MKCSPASVAAGPCRGGTGRCISHCKYRQWTPTCGVTSRSTGEDDATDQLIEGPGNPSKVQDDPGASCSSPGGISQIRWLVARSFSSTSWPPDWLSGGTTCRCSAVAPSNRIPVYEVADAGGQYAQYLRAPVKYLRSFRGTDLLVEVCNGMPFLAPLWRRGPTLCLVNHVHTDQWSLRFGPLVAAAWTQNRIRCDALGSTEEPRRHDLRVHAVIAPGNRDPRGADSCDSPGSRGTTAPRRKVDRRHTSLLWGDSSGTSASTFFWRCGSPYTGRRAENSPSSATDRPGRSSRALKVEGVEFTGFVSEAEKHRLMSEAWLLLHPASWEGWGLVITEAAVRGTPAVGFDVPGVRDAIVDFETGLLATDPESFKRHWLRLAEDADLRARLGEAGIKRSLSAPWKETVDAFEHVAAEAVLRRYAQTPTGRYRAKRYGEMTNSNDARVPRSGVDG